MDLMVPSLDNFTMESVSGFATLMGDVQTLSLTSLTTNMGQDGAGQQFGGKLATVSFMSEEEMNAPMRSFSDLPDVYVSDDFVVPDLGATIGTQLAAIPRQQSHPMGGDTTMYTTTAAAGMASETTSAATTTTTTSDGYSPSSNSPNSPNSATSDDMALANFGVITPDGSASVSRSVFDTHTLALEAQFAARAAEAQAAAVNRLVLLQQQQRDIAALGRQQFMESSSEEEEELERELMGDVQAPRNVAPSAARTPKRNSRNVSRQHEMGASPNNSRRMVSRWPDRVLDLETKALNRYLKNADLAPRDVAELKKERRRKKNRMYAMTSRHKRKVTGGGESPLQDYDDALSEGVYDGLLVVPSHA